MATKKTKVEFSAETSKYEKSMRNVRRESKKTAQSIKSSFTRIAGSLGKIGALASVVGVAGFGILAKEALDTGDKIHKLNLRLGLSTEALSQLQHVADLSGVEFMTVAKSVQKMQENISDAAQGIGTAKDSLGEINLNFMQLKGLSPEKQFEAIADAMLGVANQADKVKIAGDIFGGKGIEMLQLMTDGAAGIRKMREEADRLGITLSQEGAQAIADANDSMARIQASVKGITRSLIVELAPGIERVSGEITDWIVLNKGLIEQKMPEYIDKITSAITGIVSVYNSLPTGVVAATGYGLIGTMLFGPQAGAVIALISLTSSKINKFKADHPEIFGSKELKFYPVMHPPSRLDQALADPNKYFGAMKTPSDEQLQRTKEYYKQLEDLARDKRNSMLELEDEETRIFRENLDYRLELQKQYYSSIEEAAQEARNSEEEMEDQKMRMAGETAAYQKNLAEIETTQRLSFYQSMASGIANTFMQIAQAGGKSSKEAFRLYQGFAITEAIIAANLAAAKVLGQTGIFGIPLSSMVWGMAMANVAMIAAAQPPSYDEGGISRAAGIYQTGPIAEAHIPLKGGAVPVHLDARRAGGINVTNNFVMNNPVFQDLETQQQTMALIADSITKNVAPGAVVQNYNDDGIVRQMVRGGL